MSMRELSFTNANKLRIDAILKHLSEAYHELDIVRKTAPMSWPIPSLERQLLKIGETRRSLMSIREHLDE